jgi:hypothetical protein
VKLGVQTIVIIRAGTDSTDAWGNPVEGWDDPTETTVTGCNFQPSGGAEFINGQQATEDLGVAWVDPATDVLPTDRIEYEGDLYDVASDVERWDFPPMAHKTFKVRRVEVS